MLRFLEYLIEFSKFTISVYKDLGIEVLIKSMASGIVMTGAGGI